MLDWIQSNLLVVVAVIIMGIIVFTFFFLRRPKHDKESSEAPVENNRDEAPVMSEPESAVHSPKYEEKVVDRSSNLKAARVSDKIGLEQPDVYGVKEERGEKIQKKNDIKVPDEVHRKITVVTEERVDMEFNESLPKKKSEKENIPDATGVAEKIVAHNIDFKIPEELDQLFMDNSEVVMDPEVGDSETSPEDIKKKTDTPSSKDTGKFVTDADLNFLDLEEK